MVFWCLVWYLSFFHYQLVLGALFGAIFRVFKPLVVVYFVEWPRHKLWPGSGSICLFIFFLYLIVIIMPVPYSNRTVDIIIPDIALKDKPKLSCNCSEICGELIQQVPELKSYVECLLWLSNSKVRVTFTSGAKMEDFLHLGVTFRGQPLTFRSVSRPQNFIKRVTILRLAYGIPEEEVKKALSPYGYVSKIEFTSVQGIRIGSRTVYMTILKPIPSQLTISGHTCLLFYRGQIRTCFKCGKPGHSHGDCPGPSTGPKTPHATSGSSQSGNSQTPPAAENSSSSGSTPHQSQAPPASETEKSTDKQQDVPGSAATSRSVSSDVSFADVLKAGTQKTSDSSNEANLRKRKVQPDSSGENSDTPPAKLIIGELDSNLADNIEDIDNDSLDGKTTDVPPADIEIDGHPADTEIHIGVDDILREPESIITDPPIGEESQVPSQEIPLSIREKVVTETQVPLSLPASEVLTESELRPPSLEPPVVEFKEPQSAPPKTAKGLSQDYLVRKPTSPSCFVSVF